MIVVKNKLIPFSGYKAVTLWPFIFVRHELSGTDMNHEKIHGRQQAEMLIVLFLLWYGLEWLFRLCQYRTVNKAYKNVSMEREAYGKEADADYLKHRRLWAWVKYL